MRSCRRRRRHSHRCRVQNSQSMFWYWFPLVRFRFFFCFCGLCSVWGAPRAMHLLIVAYRLLFKLFSMRLLCVNIVFSIYEPFSRCGPDSIHPDGCHRCQPDSPEIPHSTNSTSDRLFVSLFVLLRWRADKYQLEISWIEIENPPHMKTSLKLWPIEFASLVNTLAEGIIKTRNYYQTN